jgi:hypothetical protein
VPGCFVHLDQTRLGLTKEQVVERLSAGDAPVAVATFPHGVLVNPIELAPDEDDLVAARLRAVLSGGG